MPSRREVLSMIGGISTVLISGCSTNILNTSKSEERHPIEVIVTNDTDKKGEFKIRILNQNDELLLDHTYIIKPNHVDSTQTLPSNSTIGKIHAISPSREEFVENEINPLDPRCMIKDISITISKDTFTAEMTCDAWKS